MLVFFFFKQKTSYEMRISDGSSDVCSSDLGRRFPESRRNHRPPTRLHRQLAPGRDTYTGSKAGQHCGSWSPDPGRWHQVRDRRALYASLYGTVHHGVGIAKLLRSEEHTSELQSLMRISYAVFCLKKKK